MGKQTLAKSIGNRLIVVASIFLAIGLVISYFLIENIKENVYSSAKENLQLMLQEKVNGKQTAGITNAVSISQSGDIKTAFRTDDRELAITSLMVSLRR